MPVGSPTRRGRSGPIFSACPKPFSTSYRASAADRLPDVRTERPELTASRLAGELPITRQAVAKHLAALHRAGLVEPHREGRETHYRLTPAPLADAVPLTDLTVDHKYSESIIRGSVQRWPRFDPRPCPLPPHWRRLGGYKSIFAHQQAEAG